jgi:predicted transcriptional regulator YdeE
MRYLLLSFALVSVFWGCSSDSKTQSGESSSPEKQPISDTLKDEGFVKTDKNYFIRESHRPQMLVVGKSFETTPESVRTLITGMNRALLDDITAQKAIIQGAITVIYEKAPSENEKQNIWVGIPLDKPLKGWNTVKIPAQDYYKVQTNSALGETMPYWKSVMSDLAEKDLGNKKTWFLEMPSSSVNAEMTSEVTNCNLFISK